MQRIPVIVGNWKMNKTIAESKQFVAGLLERAAAIEGIEFGVGAPFTTLSSLADVLKQHDAGKRVILAAQNCHPEAKGAFTGETSLPMLADVGCSAVIVGHSERRQYFGEDDAFINRKVRAVLSAGLTPIMCIGERLEQREAGQTFSVVGDQLRRGLAEIDAEEVPRVIVAYEPVWAIGTGKTATPEQAQEVHAHLRGILRDICGEDPASRVRIQYGGSVKPSNVTELMALPDVDGALVGGASLELDSFIQLLNYRA